MITTIEQMASDERRVSGDESKSSVPSTGNSQPSTLNSQLLDDLAALLPRFVVLPKHAAETLALWIVHTYCFQFRDVSTYIGVESPEKRCGKTTLLGILSKLVHQPIIASNISPSAFFRVIEEMQPTLLIDEADTFLQGNDELRGIFNAGYYRPNAYVIRVSNEGRVAGSRRWGPEGKGTENGLLSPALSSKGGEGVPSSTINSQPSTLVRYSCWCPKCIASIGHLPDTLADRCIVIRMQRKRGEEECERLRNLDGTELRQQCAQFALDHQDAIAKARPEVPKALNDRAADIWEPLFVIADIIGGDWPQIARNAAIALTSAAQDTNPIASLLLDISLVFILNQAQRLFSRTLVEGLMNRSPERPWFEARRGKEINELWLAQQLRPYGVRPKTLWINGDHAKGYVLDDFQEVFRRYIPKPEAEAYLAELRHEAAQTKETDHNPESSTCPPTSPP